MKEKLFQLIKTKTKENGIIIEEYEPLKNLYIDSINLENGEIKKVKIIKASKHKNLKIYEIKDDIFNSFETFYASEDHSLIIYDLYTDTLKKVSPLDIIKAKKERKTWYFIQYEKDRFSLIQKKDLQEKTILNKLLLQKCILIPISDISIKLDSSKKEAYDLTLEENFTFCTHDGIFVQDTFSIYSLMTKESQEDAKKLMLNPIPAKSPKAFLWDFKQDIQLGVYLLTRDIDENDFLLKNVNIENRGTIKDKDLIENYKKYLCEDNYHIYDFVTLIRTNDDGEEIYRHVNIRFGKALFNSIFDFNFLNHSYKETDSLIDIPVTKKVFPEITSNLVKYYNYSDTLSIITDKIREIGVLISTLYPIGLLLNEFLNAKKFNQLKEKYNNAKSLEEKQKITSEIENYLKQNIAKDLPMLSILVVSGARGNVNQIRQLFINKGIIQDSTGNIKSINNNFLDGFGTESYFYSGYSARKGMMDRALNTANTGYLMRKLIYSCSSVKLSENILDCKTKHTLKVKITDKNKNLLVDRYIVENNKLILLSLDNIDNYLNKDIYLRSPIFCKSKEICHICVGKFIEQLHTKYIGILAGETLGERGTQEIMKTFHTGGSTSISVPDLFSIIKENNLSFKINDFKNYFIQESIYLKTKKPIKFEIVIDISDYESVFKKSDFLNVISPNESNLIQVNNKNKLYVTFPYLILDSLIVNNKIKFNNLIIDNQVSIPYESIIDYLLVKDSKENKLFFRLLLDTSKSNNIFLLTDLESSDLNNLMSIILSLIEKKNKIIKNPQQLFNKLVKIYGNFGIAYLYIEILISQLFRDKKDKSLPARITEYKDYKVVGIKDINVNESWLSGLLFENIQKSLEYGFISKATLENPLEQLITKQIVFD